MSLLKLLTTGKSLEGAKETGNRYRMTSQGFLPKFGGKKNPFRKPDADAGQTTTEAMPPMEEQLPASAQVATSALAGRQSGNLLRLGTSKARELAVAALHNRWTSQLSSLWSRSAATSTKAPKAVKAAAVPVFAKQTSAQGELSLDRIKVVRNDLSDTDLEIVQATRKASAIPAPPANPAKAGEAASAAPERALSLANH